MKKNHIHCWYIDLYCGITWCTPMPCSTVLQPIWMMLPACCGDWICLRWNDLSHPPYALTKSCTVQTIPVSSQVYNMGPCLLLSGGIPGSILILLCGVTCLSKWIILAIVSASTGILVVVAPLKYSNNKTYSWRGMISPMMFSDPSPTIDAISWERT